MRLRVLAVSLIVAAFAVFYVVGATTHAERVNLSKGRGDQNGYLWDAERVYANWHGQTPPYLIGARNRMPLYAGFLALLYHPSMSDPRFFEVGRVANVYLSLGLLALLAALLLRTLPVHRALNLVGATAFGYFIFKAGYTQSELLFYTVFFIAFVSIWAMFGSPSAPRLIGLGILAGAASGLAHLTKASVPPLVAIAVSVGGLWTVLGVPRSPDSRFWRASAFAALVVTFALVLWPYISTNKRVFGQYFYNVNSTFYVWYDNWPKASVGTALHGDGEGWPTMPPEQIPTARSYLREHSSGQIARRVVDGFADMGVVLRRDYDLLPYLAVYLAGFVFVAVRGGNDFARALAARRWQLSFFSLYLLTYLVATAFYHPISGTGTGRFLLAHVLPTLFVVNLLLSDQRLQGAAWKTGSFDLRLTHVDWLITGLLVFNVVVRVWPRLMTTYGGF